MKLLNCREAAKELGITLGTFRSSVTRRYGLTPAKKVGDYQTAPTFYSEKDIARVKKRLMAYRATRTAAQESQP